MTGKNQTHDPLNVDEALVSSEAFLLKNKNVLLGAVIAVVVIVCGFLGYKHFISAPNEQKASEALFKGEQYFGSDEYETALNGLTLQTIHQRRVIGWVSGVTTAFPPKNRT